MKNKTDISIKLLIIILSISLPQLSFAEDDEPRWYQIELIVFTNNNLQEAASETWPDEPGRPSDKNYTELVSPIPQPIIEAPIETSDNADGQSIDEQQVIEAQAAKLAELTAATAAESNNPENSNTFTNQESSSSDENKEEIVIPFGILNPEDNKLTLSAQKIERSDEYDLLLHVNWRQPVFTSKDKRAVFLHDKLNDALKEMLAVTNESIIDPNADPAASSVTDNSYLPQVTDTQTDPFKTTETATNYPFGRTPDQIPVFEDSEENEPTGPDAQRFFGAFRLSLSRFLHIDIDLAYRTEINAPQQQFQDPMTDVSFDNQPVNTDILINDIDDVILQESKPILKEFRLLESRRIKPDEIHYFDHPAFGVIVMVSRYELPKPKEEESLMQPFLP